MSVCILQNLEKDRVLWTDFLASCREINRFSVSKIGPEPAKPTISLALGATHQALMVRAIIKLLANFPVYFCVVTTCRQARYRILQQVCSHI